MEWAQVIVVILVIVLSVFVLAIVTLVIMVLRLTLQIKSVMRSAEHVVENLSQAMTSADMATKGAALFTAILGKAKQKYRKKKENRNEQ